MSETAALKAENERLKKALWPFSEFERQLGAMFNMLGGPKDHEPDDPADGEIITAANGKGAQFTLRRRHFQAAHAVLTEESK